MSRGFVKEEDQEEPVFIPPRAPLPPGMENLVTPRGLALLKEERAQLEASRDAVTSEGPARRRELAEINGRIALLEDRIASARLVEPVDRPGSVRFGTTVTYRVAVGAQQGVERTFSLVGVDEAKVAEGRIAFTSPLAQALLGKRVGERVDFRPGPQHQVLEVVAIA
jgi:transcription elongation factor GreB